MSRPTPTPGTTPNPQDACEQLAASIEDAASRSFEPNDARKASLTSRLAGCPDVRDSLSDEAKAWLEKHSI